jgi:Zn-dependent protease
VLNNLVSNPLAVLESVIIILVSLTVHEFGHSAMAIRLGDDTPRREGRLTLNPLAHVDIIGFLMLLIAGFGWAKPVRFNPQALKKPQRDEILIALAGPAANLLLAVLFGLASRGIYDLRYTLTIPTAQVLFDIATQVAVINVSLMLFNLLPIPPLDGSHLVTTWLVKVNHAAAVTYFRYGSWALLGLILAERLLKVDILPIGTWTYSVVVAFYRLLGIA